MNYLDLKLLWVCCLVAVCTSGCFRSGSISSVGGSSVGDSSLDARYRRDAQSLASVCAAAQAAGWNFVIEGNGDLDQTIELIRKGHTISDKSSTFDGIFFGAGGIRGADLECIVWHLKIQNDMLIYLGKEKAMPIQDQKIDPQIAGGAVALSLVLLIGLIVFICKKVSRKKS